MTTNNQNIGIVLSASRMTDMPKFYPNELIEEVEKRRSKGQLIHTLVMWTKHPKSLLVDPIIRFKDTTGAVYSNADCMPKIIAATSPLGIKTYSFSFVESVYTKVIQRFSKIGATLMPPTDTERADFKAWIDQLSRQYGVGIFSCSVPGLPKSACIDGALLEQLHDSHMPVSKKQQNHRELCGCTDSIDIGGWPPKKCYTGCQYCYARSSY